MKKRTCLIILSFLFCSIFTWAQTRIKGTVCDEQGETLPGVNIVEKGTTNGVISNFDGQFSISINSPKPTLVISFIGFETQEISSPKNGIKITLKNANTQLEEVVAIGYGVKSKRDLTGSVASISADNIETSVISNATEALAGRIAGVQVVSPSGSPGSGISLNIRGLNSISGSSSPLYVVDGFVGVDPSTIDASEITNMEILKDASATSIYGSQGANGVVIITTNNLSKKGKNGFSVSATAGFNEVIKRFDMLNGSELYQMLTLMVPGKDIYTEWAETYTDVDGINWQNEALRKAVYQNYKASFKGSSNSTDYYGSVSYNDEEGIIKHTGFNKLNINIRGEHRFNKKVSVKSGVSYNRQEKYGKSSNGKYGAYVKLLTARPHFGDQNLLEQDFILDEDGTLDYNNINPISELENYHSLNIEDYFRGDFELTYKVTPSLRLVSRIANQWRYKESENFQNNQTSSGRSKNGIASYNTGKYNKIINDNLVYYTPKLGRQHKLNLMAGFTQQESISSSNKVAADGFDIDALGVYGIPMGNTQKLPSMSKSKSVLYSYIGRLDYTLKDRYLFNFNFRADGSSKFGDGNEWGYFPSGSFAWRMSEEKFIKSVKQISNLKVRTSYGVNGNQGISSYQSLSTYKNANYTLDNGFTVGTAPKRLENQELKWETTRQANVGLDIGLFSNRLNITTDAYYKKTTDLLLTVNVPSTSGFTSYLMNFGSLENRGIEFDINALLIKNKMFQWNVNFNISHNKNKVLKLSNDNSYQLLDDTWESRIPDEFLLKEGESIGLMYGYKFDGVYQLNHFLYDDINGPYELKGNVPQLAGQTKVKPGFVKYRDLNNDGVVNADDRTVIGSSTPEFFGGFGSTFKYKALSCNLLFTYQYDVDILNGYKLEIERMTGSSNKFASVLDYWSIENQDTDMPKPGIDAAGPYMMSDRYIEDASYLRLKTVSLSYNVPRKYLTKMGIQSANIQVAGKNLWTTTDYTGTDPEVSISGNSLTRGVDYGTYPLPRTYVVSLKMNF
ncbi:TonB-dependent receptor [Puteibacter caeruleilacunae]|nr:TonB-dependent receptor [Puteibacter caeruleilacunae]